jgi:hypothetical protein
MKTFNQYILTEGFDKPFKWKWDWRGSLGSDAEFETDDGLEYTVVFTRYGGPVWERVGMIWTVEFKIKDFFKHGYSDPWAITGSGSAFRVFATVIDIMKDFLKSEKPDVVMFTAVESSRKELYRVMMKRVSRFARDYVTIPPQKKGVKEYYFLRRKSYEVPEDVLAIIPQPYQRYLSALR